MPRQKLFYDEEVTAMSIRVPVSMKAVIEKRARENRRSLNQEIVWILEQAINLLSVDENPTDKKP